MWKTDFCGLLIDLQSIKKFFIRVLMHFYLNCKTEKCLYKQKQQRFYSGRTLSVCAFSKRNKTLQVSQNLNTATGKLQKNLVVIESSSRSRHNKKQRHNNIISRRDRRKQ